MLAQAVQSYLEVRRACGFELRSQGKLLMSFAKFSEKHDLTYVCTQVAIEWAGLARSRPQRARRLGEVIRFARHARAEDPQHELPPPVFGKQSRTRPTPYILSMEETQRIVQAASEAGYVTLRRQTYSTLFALLACTGLRVSEALALRFEDITPDGLVIRHTKFRKSRMVPLHPSAVAELERYIQTRRTYAPFDNHVFVSLRRKPIRLEDVESAFRVAARNSGVKTSAGQARITPHSLRHAFAVRSLQGCSYVRSHVTQHMVALSTYLGHAKVSDTYWYLEATAQLMQDIALASESFITGDRS